MKAKAASKGAFGGAGLRRVLRSSRNVSLKLD
jgi:hypothetical protein